jgi:hypothetical protein
MIYFNISHNNSGSTTNYKTREEAKGGYEVDHIICDMVGACVASTSEEMEWNAQGKGIT